MRKLLFFISLVFAMGVSAQVDNYALEFTGTDGIANLGKLNTSATFAEGTDWTLQFWVNPSEWIKKAPLIRCGEFSIKLGNEHALVLNDGTNHLTMTTSLISAGKWAQVTVRSSKSKNTTEVVVNNARTFTLDSYLAIRPKSYSIWLGGGFKGRIDEVRLFRCILTTDYASFWNNTINKFCPQYNKMVGYWKMEQTNCENIVNYVYTAISSGKLTEGIHGTLSGSVQRSKVTDNAMLRYCKTLAYDNINHVVNYWSSISSDLYGCLANHVAILGGYGTDDGHAYLDGNTEAYFKKMREASGNLDGQKYIVTFHQMNMSDLSGTMSNAAKRQTMAEDMINIAKKDWVDGIDIDYEWFYSTAGWQYIADMLKIVRAGMPEGKIISVTPHNVTYAYPTSGFGDVDYFEFQQYGPQTTHSNYNTFLSYAQKFVDYGFPKDKIMLSYSTTSDNGGGAGVIGYNWNSANISEDNDEFTYNGHTYHINSLRQVEQRTLYARDNGYGGIFCWDMCNDVNPSSTKSYFRASSMYMNSNTQLHVTAVRSSAALPENDKYAPIATTDPEDQGGTSEESVQIKTLDELAANQKAVNLINTNGLGIIYSNPSQTNVWLGESSNTAMGQSVDHDSDNASWVITRKNNKWYIYNVGRGEFAKLPVYNSVSNPTTFSADASAVEVECDGNGVFCFKLEGQTNEKSWMCASPQLTGKPVCHWTDTDNGSTWKIVTSPQVNSKPAYAAVDALITYSADKTAWNNTNAITTLNQIDETQAYNIINTNGLGIIYNNTDQTNVWIAESSNSSFSGTTNHFTGNALWLLVKDDDDRYNLWNIGAQSFVNIPAFNVTSQPCVFQADGFAIDVTCSGGSFQMHEALNSDEKGYMCAAPQLSANPVAQWTKDDSGCQWRLVKFPGYDASASLLKAKERLGVTGIIGVAADKTANAQGAACDLQGRRLNAIPAHGVFIRNGKVFVR